MDTHTLEDLLSHYGELFRDTADILKKSRDIKSFGYYDSNSQFKQIKSIPDLKEYLKAELEAYLESLDDI